jgi:hypothetical protein
VEGLLFSAYLETYGADNAFVFLAHVLDKCKSSRQSGRVPRSCLLQAQPRNVSQVTHAWPPVEQRAGTQESVRILVGRKLMTGRRPPSQRRHSLTMPGPSRTSALAPGSATLDGITGRTRRKPPGARVAYAARKADELLDRLGPCAGEPTDSRGRRGLYSRQLISTPSPKPGGSGRHEQQADGPPASVTSLAQITARRGPDPPSAPGRAIPSCCPPWRVATPPVLASPSGSSSSACSRTAGSCVEADLARRLRR